MKNHCSIIPFLTNFLKTIPICFVIFVLYVSLSHSIISFKKEGNFANCSHFIAISSWRMMAATKVIPVSSILTLDVVFRQIEIVLKDSTAFVYVTKSEKLSHFTLMT